MKTTSKEVLTMAMKGMDLLNNAQRKPEISPADKAALKTAEEIVEAVINKSEYEVHYPNGNTPRLRKKNSSDI